MTRLRTRGLLPVEQPSLDLDAVELPPTTRPAVPGRRSRAERRAKARAVQEAGARRWIDAGKPIALMVARRDGQVTAETFRAAAAPMGQLPPAYGNQRALSWLPGLFRELVAAGQLRKRLHPDGSPVKVYSKEQGNDQVVYEPTEGGAT